MIRMRLTCAPQSRQVTAAQHSAVNKFRAFNNARRHRLGASFPPLRKNFVVGGVPRAQRKESLEGEEEEEESDADNGTHTAHSGSSDDAWESWSDAPDTELVSDVSASDDSWIEDLGALASSLRSELSQEQEAVDAEARASFIEGIVPRERAYLVGAALKSAQRPGRIGYGILESLEELGRLADTAGLEVVGHTHQLLDDPNPRTYIGTGKVAEIVAAVQRTGAETVIFDDELSPGQLRNLDRALGGECRLCDRTALILDIFSQRAASREGKLQVELAQVEYQIPRLTKMWAHLERQSGSGQVKGMGEKQIEIDRRLLRNRAARLRRDIEEVRTHRKAYRDRRASTPIPVVALVGYTNAGKSTLLNTLTNAGVLAEDQLFATLDPTTRRVNLPGGKEVLLSDTVGFIQKLPTQLVAAFNATLEEIKDAALLLHVVDASHTSAAAQVDAVNKVLKDLGVINVPTLTVWNKLDACADPEAVAAVASRREGTVVVSGLSGEGVENLLGAVSTRLQNSMQVVRVLIPYAQGDLVEEIHRCGVVDEMEYTEGGALMQAHVPPNLASKLEPLFVTSSAAEGVFGQQRAEDFGIVLENGSNGSLEDSWTEEELEELEKLY
jgi:GTP-binding protein HflX